MGKASSAKRTARPHPYAGDDRTCEHCLQVLSSKYACRQHVRLVHEKRRDHACPFCASAVRRRAMCTTVIAQITSSPTM